MEKLSCAQAKQIDLVDYLASLGHNPHKVNRDDYWYLSPFRDEKTPSFKVNRKLNVWFDFGEGKGGDLINFGTRYLKCTVNELLEKLRGSHPAQTFSFQPPSQAGEKKDTSTGKILILDDRRLAATPLLQYLQKRCIPVEIAEQFCREVDFLLYEKKIHCYRF
jgi:DNA primase